MKDFFDGLSTAKVEVYEERVFRAAMVEGYFTVWRKDTAVVGKGHTMHYSNFPDAALAAFNDPRALVYAVTSTGRSVCIPRKDWKRYLELIKSHV